MMQTKPRFFAVSAYLKRRSGVRCAETTLVSQGIPKNFSCSTALCITPQSLLLPITTPTKGFFIRLLVNLEYSIIFEVTLDRSEVTRHFIVPIMIRFLGVSLKWNVKKKNRVFIADFAKIENRLICADNLKPNRVEIV